MSFAPSALWRFWVACVLCMLIAAAGSGQPAPMAGKLTGDDREMVGALTLDLNAYGRAHVDFDIGPQQDTDKAVDWRRLPNEREIVSAVEQSIGGTLRHVHSDLDGTDDWRLTASCDDAFRRRYWRVVGHVEGARLVAALADAGLTTITVRVRHHNIGQVRSAPLAARPTTNDTYVELQQSFKTGADARPGTVTVDYGYGREALLRVLGPMIFVLALPLLTVAWLRRWALHTGDADPTAVWFSYARWPGYVALALWLLWFIGLFALDWMEFFNFVVQSGSRQLDTLLGACLLFGLPGAVLVCMAGMGWPVYARVRGVDITAGDLMRQALWSNLAQIAPTILAVTAITAFGERRFSAVALWLAAAYFGRRMLLQQAARNRQMVPQAITTGELRDRIFALAERAGVKLGQIYLLPAGKFRSANAFAMTGNNVLLTDYLLERLSKREIDAVMAHELAHLRHHHPANLRRAGVLCVVLPGSAWIALIRLNPAFYHGGAVVFPLMAVAGLLITYWLSRRYERVADAEAVRLTSDAPALIAALAKISRLNMLPLTWGRGEAMLTHPSTLRRAEALAQQGGVPTERLPDLLAGAEPDTERYTAVNAGDGERPVFSTTLKARWLQANAWTVVWISILTPALFAAVDRWLPVPSDLAWLYWLTGLVVTLAALALAEDRLAARRCPELGRKVTARLAHEGIPPPHTEGYFVGFAPDARPALYQGFTMWDMGLLVLTGDRLCYVGEQTRFALRRAEIIEARIGPGAPGLQPRPTLYITWRDPVLGIDHTFNMRSADAGTLRGVSRDTIALAKRLQTWRQEPERPGLLPPALAGLSTPERSKVTSVSPRAPFRPAILLRVIWIKTLLAIGVCLVAGLPLRLFPPEAGWYVVAVAAATTLVQAWKCRK